MTDITLPAPIEAWIRSISEADGDAFVALFCEQGLVDDWGSRHVGRGAIRSWSDREFIGARGRLVPIRAQQSDNQVTLIAEWVSDYYNGHSRFVFVLEGDKILEMRITSA